MIKIKHKYFDVSSLLKEDIDELATEDSIEIDDDNFKKIQIRGKITYKLRLYRTNIGILGKGKVRYKLDLTCSRCLKDIKEEIEAIFEEVFLKEEKKGMIKSNAKEIFMIKNMRIDVVPPIRQLTLLSNPLKPLCKPDCKGLCQYCGIDLNQQKCGCQKKNIDVRWEALKKYKTK